MLLIISRFLRLGYLTTLTLNVVKGFEALDTGDVPALAVQNDIKAEVSPGTADPLWA